MENFKTIFGVFTGCLSVTFIAWFTVHLNGKTIISVVDSGSILVNKLINKSHTSPKWLPIATEAEVITVGVAPVAIASLVATYNNRCQHSVTVFFITEFIILSLFFLNFKQSKWKQNLFGRNFFKDNFIIFALTIVWCFLFSIWGFIATDFANNTGAARLLLNSNGDMWFYARRFAAYTLDNISFDNLPACEYIQISPKKFSSFVGSIIVYFSPNSSLGITLFQGLFGCSLFLSLFGNWCNFTYNGKSLSRQGTFLAILWAITSPSISWLIITSYQSNILFITMFVLGLTATRKICLNQDKYPQFAIPILMFGFIVNIYAFYIVLLPVALLFYLATLVIYQYEKYLTPHQAAVSFLKILLTAGICILLCAVFLNNQMNLEEIGSSLDVTRQHSKNFVPLNPWTLLQERLNPMPTRKDFGVWLNIIIGTVFSGFVLKAIYNNLFSLNQQGKSHTFYYKDLIAAALVIVGYLIYLWAYIPLEFTYRLGKFAISIIYPLAILGLLPIILWYRDRYYQSKSNIFKSVCLGLIILHIILHIDKALTSAKIMGKYNITSASKLNEVESLTIVKCDAASASQNYQKVVGLDLKKKYPDLKINVITDVEFDRNTSKTDVVIRGKDVKGEEDNFCIFDLDI